MIVLAQIDMHVVSCAALSATTHHQKAREVPKLWRPGAAHCHKTPQQASVGKVQCQAGNEDSSQKEWVVKAEPPRVSILGKQRPALAFIILQATIIFDSSVLEYSCTINEIQLANCLVSRAVLFQNVAVLDVMILQATAKSHSDQIDMVKLLSQSRSPQLPESCGSLQISSIQEGTEG